MNTCIVMVIQSPAYLVMLSLPSLQPYTILRVCPCAWRQLTIVLSVVECLPREISDVISQRDINDGQKLFQT